MYTLEYSFHAGLIYPEQLKLILRYADEGCKLGPFSTISIPLKVDGLPSSLEQAHSLAEELNKYSFHGLGGVDISSMLRSGGQFVRWQKFEERLNVLTKSVCYPFYQIKLGNECLFSSDADTERRFTSLHKRNKICIETQTHHEWGLYSYDLAFVVSEENEDIVHLFAGGGGGIYGGSSALAPRAATWLGMYNCEEAFKIGSFLMKLNEEWGETENPRKRRLKSLFATRGMGWIREKLLETGIGIFQGKEPRFHSSGEWAIDQKYNDRLVVTPFGEWEYFTEYQFVTFLNQLLPLLSLPLFLTPQGNLRINENDAELPDVAALLKKYPALPVRVTSFACKGAPSCKRGRAPSAGILRIVTREIEEQLMKWGIDKEPVIVRISGCPNGCSKPLFAEISLIGRTEQTYDLFAGGSVRGDRPGVFLRKGILLEELGEIFTPLFAGFAEAKKDRKKLSFGDWIFSELNLVHQHRIN